MKEGKSREQASHEGHYEHMIIRDRNSVRVSKGK